MYKLNNGVLMYESSRTVARPGSLVMLKLHDDRVMQAEIILIEQTIAGIKIRAQSNNLLWNRIEPEQIIEVLEY